MYAAIDFETADNGRDSACAVGVVFVEGNSIVERLHQLIRPPRRDFYFSYLHGITWADVAEAPSFAELWPSLGRQLAKADFLVAHNATFDRSVLKACCAGAGRPPIERSFVCSMKLARAVWDIYPTKLPDVCARLRVRLNHHDAASDAEAAARIVMAAKKDGISVFECPAGSVARKAGSHCRSCPLRATCLFNLAER
jgi:DNA polymerase III subunit epsilon